MTTTSTRPATAEFLGLVAQEQRNQASRGRQVTRAQASAIVARRRPELHQAMQAENTADPQIRSALLAGAKAIHPAVRSQVANQAKAAPTPVASAPPPAASTPVAQSGQPTANTVAVVPIPIPAPHQAIPDPLGILCSSDQSAIMARLNMGW